MLKCYCGSEQNFENCCEPFIKGYKNRASILDWSQSNKWIKLEVLNTTTTTVEFKAFYLDTELKMQVHHEYSTFKIENEKWFYVDGTFT